MKTHKLDNHIQKKLANRTVQPSASAWERLSNELDVQEKKKKRKTFLYIGYAATILMIISLGIFIPNNNKQVKIQNSITVNPIDTNSIEKKIDFLNTNFKIIEKAIVNNDEQVKEPNLFLKDHRSTKSLKNTPFKTQNRIAEVTITKEKNNTKKSTIELKYQKLIEENKKSSKEKTGITINSTDLLYAVTHTKEEVEAYYVKYNIDRNEVLKAIKTALKKTGVKINSNTILAEIERTLDEDAFENNFIKVMKNRIKNMATTITSRNN